MPLANLSRYRAELMGFAILWIMLYHADVVLPGPLHPLLFVKYVGYGAVDVFFLLSGFGCACGWARSRPAARAFLAHRLRRLAPAYVVTATLWALLGLWPRGELSVGSFAALLTGLNYLLSRDTVFWFVPAIAVLYLAFPTLARILAAPDATRSVARTGATAFLFMAVSSLVAMTGLTDYLLLTERVPEFALGVLLGDLLSRDGGLRLPAARVWAALALGAVVLVLVMHGHSTPQGRLLGLRYAPFWLLTLPLCVTAAGLMDAARRARRLGWLLAALRFCGTNSLELYLLHVLVFELQPLGPAGPWPLPRAAWTTGRLVEFAAYAAVAALLAPGLRRLASKPSHAASQTA